MSELSEMYEAGKQVGDDEATARFSSAFANINDTCRARGFTAGPSGKSTEDRVIALAQAYDALLEEVKPFRPMSVEECEAAFDEADAVPISDEEIEHGVNFATDPVYRANHLQQRYNEQWRISRGFKAEIDRLRTRLLSAAGDDLCRLSQEEIKAMSAGAVKIPPKEEFLASCERFHAQVAGEAGVLTNCLTLAQLIAENERLRSELVEAEKAEESAVSGAATMLHYAERVTALYRQERARWRDYHAPRASWQPYTLETQAQARERCERELQEYNAKWDADTEANLKAAMLPEMRSSNVADKSP